MRKVFLMMSLIAMVSGAAFAMGQRQEEPADEETALADEGMPPEEQEAAEETEAALPGKAAKDEPRISYKAESFVAPIEWEADGFITGEKEKKLLISAGDTVYVNMGFDKVKPGMTCMVYRVVGKMKDRETHDLIGYEMKRVAKLVITNGVGEKTSTAKVTVSYEPLEIGDAVTISKEKE